jgi:hypothetical protein
MTHADVIEKVVMAIGEKTGLRTEQDPVAELTNDPIIVLKYLPPAVRISRVNDEGTDLQWYRKMTCTVALIASGSGKKKMREAMEDPSKALTSLFINDDDGFDVALDDTWYAAVQGTLRQKDPLSKNEDNPGTWDWDETWDVTIYVPESAFA